MKRVQSQVVAMGALLFFFLLTAAVQAQDSATRLYITGAEAGSYPSIELHVYGKDSQGNPLDLTQTPLAIQHNGVPIDTVETAGLAAGGTFTIFLIDIPTGVSDQLPALQNAIIEFATTPYMVEQVDAVAVYQVGGTSAVELMAPETFYNGVRNLFAGPLAPEQGATALVDSMMGLLDQIESLKPDPDMVASMVVMTDGTDVVSTQFEADEVARHAAELDIPIHTVWLNNSDLIAAAQQQGQEYLAEVAAGSQGTAVWLENQADLVDIWNRIAGFRDRLRVRYTVSELAAGTFPVSVSLESTPVVADETTVTITGSTPTVVIELTDEARVLTLPDLENPVDLRFTTTIGWLDEVERQLTAAQIIVNGTSPQSIPIENISEFTAEVPNLVFGVNTVQIAILDELGSRATSPIITITVNEGSRSIPEEIRPTNTFGRIVGTFFLILLLAAILGGGGFLAWKRGWLNRLPDLLKQVKAPRVSRRKARPAGPSPEAFKSSPAQEAAPQKALGYLEVLECVSQVASPIPLTGTHVRIGRSPAQANIAFEDDITVSRMHATLMMEGSHFRIFDENSTSGSWVNDQQVPEYGIQLLDGDEIHLGAVHLRFRQ